jgi:hypothetical protein
MNCHRMEGDFLTWQYHELAEELAGGERGCRRFYTRAKSHLHAWDTQSLRAV